MMQVNWVFPKSGWVKTLISFVFPFLAVSGNLVFGSCGGGGEKIGELTSIQYQNVNGTLCGYSEYTYKGWWFGNDIYEPGDSVNHNYRFWRAIAGGSNQEPQIGGGAWELIEARKYLREDSNVIEVSNSDTPSSNVSSNFNQNFTASNVFSAVDCVVTTTCSGSGISKSIDPGYGSTATWTFLDCSTVEVTDTLEGEEPTVSQYNPWFLPALDYDGEMLLETSPTTFLLTEDLHEDYGSGDYYQYNGQETKVLSQQVDGSSVFESVIDDEMWEDGSNVYSWMGNWSAWVNFYYSGRAVRFKAKFSCIGEDDDVEITYREWPIGGDREMDGEDVIDTVSGSDFEETEDGFESDWIVVIPKDGYNKEFVKIAVPATNSSCSNHNAGAGNQNSASGGAGGGSSGCGGGS